MRIKDITLTYQELLLESVVMSSDVMYTWRGVMKLDCLIHVVVLLTHYDDHWSNCLFEVITMFLGYIWPRTCSQCHLFENVLC